MEWLSANWGFVAAAVVALLVAVRKILQLIPGDQGEAKIEKAEEIVGKLGPKV